MRSISKGVITQLQHAVDTSHARPGRNFTAIKPPDCGGVGINHRTPTQDESIYDKFGQRLIGGHRETSETVGKKGRDGEKVIQSCYDS
mgnify:CR=1 FL=1